MAARFVLARHLSGPGLGLLNAIHYQHQFDERRVPSVLYVLLHVRCLVGGEDSGLPLRATDSPSVAGKQAESVAYNTQAKDDLHASPRLRSLKQCGGFQTRRAPRSSLPGRPNF